MLTNAATLEAARLQMGYIFEDETANQSKKMDKAADIVMAAPSA